MLLMRTIQEDVPIWKCQGCDHVFSVCNYGERVSAYWGNKNRPPYCPRCGERKTEVIDIFPWDEPQRIVRPQ